MFPLRLPRLATLSMAALLSCSPGAPPQAPPPRAPTPVATATAAVSAAPPAPPVAPLDDEAAVRKEAQSWRAEHLFIDLHEHIDPTAAHLARAVAIQDAAGIGLAVNLSGGTVTKNERAESELEMTKAISDRLYPGRFLEYVNLDYADWEKPDF